MNLIKKIKTIFVIVLILSFENLVSAQVSAGQRQNLLLKINYAIITGQKNLSDSLLIELSNSEQGDQRLIEIIQVYRGLYYAYFHYDYSLDSIFILKDKTDNLYLAHWQKLIESEHYFNNADWEKTIDLSVDFASEELSLDQQNFSPLFYTISLSNVFIGRDNLLLSIDSSMSKSFTTNLNILFKNSIDSLNNGMLIKLYWASCIINPYSDESKKLKEVLWRKLLTLSSDDLAYFESVLSTYNIDTHSFYKKRNNLSLYEGITQRIISSKNGYFIRNKWLQHLLTFGLFGDNLDEDKYFEIESKYIQNQKKISPYFIGQYLINWGIYYGNKNQSISSSFFNKFFDFFSNDSIFRKQNYRLLNYASFENTLYNYNQSNKFLISFIEKNKLINGNNSKDINLIYSTSYLDQLLLNGDIKKIDSLFKFDSLIGINSLKIKNDLNFRFLQEFELLKETNVSSVYLKLKSIYFEFTAKNSFVTFASILPDIIEYAVYFNDIDFADSLLNIYESISIQAIKKFDIARLRKTDLTNLIKDYYVERSYITLYNKTQNNAYLVRLVKFKLIKDYLIKNIFSLNHLNGVAIDSLQRLLLNDDAVRSFKYITNTFNYPSDFNLFENSKTKYNLLIDSLSRDSSFLFPDILDSSNILNNFLKNLKSNTIVLVGLAGRRHPFDSLLSTYVLVIDSDINKLKIVGIEDSLFNTPAGNYFDLSASHNIEKDKFKYLLDNLRKSLNIGIIKKTCENKNEIFIEGGALVDQIPFNIILSKKKIKKIYQISNLAELNTSERNDSYHRKPVQKNNILALGGANFKSGNSSLTRDLISYLPGTLEEINFINDKLKNSYQVTMLKGKDATKSNFINYVNKVSFKIIHLATHSFYVGFNPSGNPFTKIPISILPEREFRSAIILAQGGDFENYEALKRLKIFLDKNLTLADIMYLPLNATKLVVLASCETNIGIPKIYNDIFGNISLNTAFKYAGAEFVLGTRWEVSDQYSKYFYSYFYSYLQKTDNIEFSYDNAIQDLKRANSDPYIWGTFVLTK